jgi:hypothetical protein
MFGNVPRASCRPRPSRGWVIRSSAMSELAVVHAAARNNAEWCDAFCRTYGIAGHFRADSWSSPVRTPQLYPDAITLVPDVEVELLLSDIDTGHGCSVKDSFADLDLTAAGFRVLFRAEWLLRRPSDAPAASEQPWSFLTTGEELAEWESTWAESPETTSVFRPALLRNQAVHVLARYDGGHIVAGAVANRSATVIGLSNVFDAAADLESAWHGAAEAAISVWGPMPVVSYDSGSSRDAANEAGFDRIGELVVWVTTP